MSSIEAYLKSTIFDDPNYCNARERYGEKCFFLFRGQCNHFYINLRHDFPKPGNQDLHEKCDQCKEDWKTAKGSQS